MRLSTLLWRELWERKGQMVTGSLAVLLGVAAVVAVKSIGYYSERAVERELDALGANVLILPPGTSVQDYYAADLHGREMPEEFVTRLALSDVQGVDNLSPRLCVPARVRGREVTLTGILPRSEFQAKAAWQGAGIFSRPLGCGAVVDVPGAAAPDTSRPGLRRRVIDTLAEDETLVGAEVAASLGVRDGDAVDLLGQSFHVTAVLPATGTVDDSRVFAHLHAVQSLAGKGEVVNAIEVVGCCKQIAGGLVEKIARVLPEARVVTISQIVETQARVNRLAAGLSLVILAVAAAVGAVGTANALYANVRERRREIGTLMALGAAPSLVLRLFLLKGLVLGTAGGLAGFLVGTVLAVGLGPRLAGVPVLPMPGLAAWAVGLAGGVAALAGYWPARHAARLDPCITLQEV